MKKIFFLLSTILFATLNIWAQTTRYVPCGSNTPCYATIQAAITASVNGDIIEVDAGTYLIPAGTQLIINKQVTLRAKAGLTTKPWIRTNLLHWSQCNVQIAADNVVIDGFEIDNALNGTQSGYVVGDYVNGGTGKNNWTIKNCNIHDGRNGVRIQGNNITIESNDIHGTQSDCINGEYGKCGGLKVTKNILHSEWVVSGGKPAGITYNCDATAVGNVEISYNYCYACRTFVDFQHNGGTAPANNITIMHNTVDWKMEALPSPVPAAAVAQQMSIAFWGVGNWNASKFFIRDNIFSRQKWYAIVNTSGASGPIVGSMELKNNLFYQWYLVDAYFPSNQYPMEWPGTRGAVGWATTDANFTFTDNLLVDPLYNSTGTAANIYYSLATGSPALNTASDGTCIGAWQIPPIHNLTQNIGYYTIQSAINAANPSDVIEVSSGTYNEYLTINKSLTIKGSTAGTQPTVQFTDIATAGVTITADNVTIENLRFYRPGNSADAALLLVPKGGSWPNYTIAYSNLSVKKCTFEWGRYAMYVHIQNMTVDSCKFLNNYRSGIDLCGTKGTINILHNYIDGTVRSANNLVYITTGSGTPDIEGTININYNTSYKKVQFFMMDFWGVDFSKKINLNIKHNSIDYATSKPIIFYGVPDNGFTKFASVTIQDNIISNGKMGIVIDFNTANNNALPANGQIVVDHNLFYNNSIDNSYTRHSANSNIGWKSIGAIPPGASDNMFALSGNLSGNPLYTNAAHTNQDFSLMCFSPAVNSASDLTNIGYDNVIPTVYPVSINIAADTNDISAGDPVTFTAVPNNGGSTPVYQWKVNGTNAGTNSAIYTYTPDNNDSVICVLTSNKTCAIGNPATSNTVIMSVTTFTQPISTPDINATFIDVPIPGDVHTNDDAPSGTTYGTPVLTSCPAGSTHTMTMNPDGTYFFKGNLAGVYVYEVPVCAPGSPAPPCLNEILTITAITPYVYPPVVQTDIATTRQGVPVTIHTLSNDVAGNVGGVLIPSSMTLVSTPDPVTEGSLTINTTTGNITFTPIPSFTGVVTYTYQVCDNTQPTALCETAIQQVTVFPADNPNVTKASDDYNVTAQGVNLTVSAAAGVLTNDSDPEGNTLTVTTTSPITVTGKGTITFASDGSYVFIPVPVFMGGVGFPYMVCDNGTTVANAGATLYLIVTSFNTDPDINETFVNVPVSGDVSTNDDVIGGTTYGTTPVLTSGPTGSSAAITMNIGGTYAFTTNLPGIYVYNVPVYVPKLPVPPCVNEILTIIVNAPLSNTNPPIVNTDLALALQGNAVTLNTLANDAAGNAGRSLVPSSVAVVPSTMPNPLTEGSLIIHPLTGEITFTPIPSFTGVVKYTYQVCDNSLPTALCATAMQEITVLLSGSTKADDDFNATPQGMSLTVSSDLGVLANDTDPEGDTQGVLTTSPITVPDKGTVTIATDGSYVFVPAPCYYGPVSFPYTIVDNEVPPSYSSATLYILVKPFNATANGGTIAADQTICSGSVPAAISNATLPGGYSGTTEYKWQKSVSPFTTWTDIGNSNKSSYNPGSISATTWFKRLVKVDCMTGWGGAVESNVVKITIDNTPPVAVPINSTVSINASGIYTLQNNDVLSSYSDNGTGVASVMITPPSVSCNNLGQTVTVAVVVTDFCGNHTNVTSLITVAESTALPSPWVSCVVGASCGTANYTACTGEGRFTLSSKGYSSTTSDIIESVNQPLSGDGFIIARVSSITGSGWAGLQFRESCSVGSKKVVFKTQLYKPAVRSEMRTTTNGQTTVREFVCPNVSWFKLERVGNIFKGYTSSNGQQWKLVFTLTNQMISMLQAGIISEGCSFNSFTVAQFDHVSVGNSTKETEVIAPTIETYTGRYLNIDIYPNPATDQVNISLPENQAKVKLTVTSLEGKLMEKLEFTGSGKQLDTNRWQPGMYLLRFDMDGEIITRRLVVL